MTIDRDFLLKYKIPDVTQDLTPRDTILYALGIGLGDEPTSAQQLRFLYEKELLALPTMATVLARQGSWMRNPDTGIDSDMVLHGEQGMTLHRPLPVSGRIRSQSRIIDIIDKGSGRGAVFHQERLIYDEAGALLCTLRHVNFYIGGGGFGGPPAPRPQPAITMPDRPPDLVDERRTLPQAALIYRLSGDYEPMHIDPAVSAKQGFPRPILHGLCTFGIAGYSLLSRCGDGDPSRFREMEGRFSAPIFPGETVRTEIWKTPDGLRFRSKAAERDVVVLDRGRAVIAN